MNGIEDMTKDACRVAIVTSGQETSSHGSPLLNKGRSIESFLSLFMPLLSDTQVHFNVTKTHKKWKDCDDMWLADRMSEGTLGRRSSES